MSGCWPEVTGEHIIVLKDAVRMQTLSLDLKPPLPPPHPIKRRASEFPEPADVYVCDKCGTDITAHLHRGRAHVRLPLGPVRYVCRCGEPYLSGLTEWDYLGDWDKKQRLNEVKFALVSFVLLIAYAVLVCFALTLRTRVTIVSSLLGIPLALVSLFVLIMASATTFEIIASIRRTRTSGNGG